MIRSLFFLASVAAVNAVDFYKPPAWECEGGVKYTDAPIIYYWNASDTLCYADRKGCAPSTITETYATLDECIGKKMPDGRTKSKSFMCEGKYYNNAIYTISFGKSKTKVFPILRRCHVTERFCPDGYTCSTMSTGVSACCAISRDTKGEQWVQGKYNKNYV